MQSREGDVAVLASFVARHWHATFGDALRPVYERIETHGRLRKPHELNTRGVGVDGGRDLNIRMVDVNAQASR